MTLSALFGPRTPPKSICTHRHSLQKFLTKKTRFLYRGVRRAPFGAHGLMRSKIVLNMFFGPLSISYDAWMMFDFGLKNFFLRLKNRPKMTLRPLFPLDLGVKFSKFFLVENRIKRHFRYLVLLSEKVGPVYALVRHTGGLEKFWPKSRKTRK